MENLLVDILIAGAMGLIGAVLFAAIGLVSGTDETTTHRSPDAARHPARRATRRRVHVLSGGCRGEAHDARHSDRLARHPGRHHGDAAPAAGDLPAEPWRAAHRAAQDDLRRHYRRVRRRAARRAVRGASRAVWTVHHAGGAVDLCSSRRSLSPTSRRAAGRRSPRSCPLCWSSSRLQGLTARYGVKLSISYFLGIAIGPLVADLFSVLSPADRARMHRDRPRSFSLAPDVKGWSGYFPNPFKVLDGTQAKWTVATAAISSATFVFSPVAMTVLLGRNRRLADQARLSPGDDRPDRAKRRDRSRPISPRRSFR